MNKNGINYKNSYKYDFINLYETVSGTLKPKYISYKSRNMNYLTTENQKFNKTATNYNRTSKNFHSFHKSLLHLKLTINPKFKNNKNICYTERSSRNKKEIENFKNTYEKLFLTNIDDKSRNIFRQSRLITDYKTTFNKNLINSDYISIPSDTFLTFKQNKHLYFLPDIINQKISDFKDDLKMTRHVKFINKLKVERKKRKFDLLDLKFDENEMEINLLKNILFLMNIYKKCFSEYNKFLINEIKKESKLLNDYNLFKNSLEEQVNILQKQFDDIINELEIVNNFKLIFTAIKNKKKLGDIEKLSKIFIEELKKRLKTEVFSKKKNISISTKKTVTKRSSKKSKPKKLSIGELSLLNFMKKNNFNLNEAMKKIKIRKSVSITNIPKTFKKKIERLNTFQKSIDKKSRLAHSSDPDNLDYDIDRNERIIINNILRFFKRYNDINSNIVHLKIASEREDPTEEYKRTNKIIANQKDNLLYAKNYNKSLISKYKILRYNNNDYSLHISIYLKINKTISSVISSKVKNFDDIIEKLKKIYDKNKLYYAYKTIINEPKSRRSYFEKELINYLYNAITYIEILQCKLITKKNEYLNNNLYQDKIIEYENKMDMYKKIINNREKKNREIMLKQQMYDNMIKKSNKIIFKPFKKVPMDYQFIFKNGKNKNTKKDEDEEFLFY